MSSAPEPAAILATLNETVEKLQKSARTTIPIFAIGIVATVIAAAVAVYYIVTLSADLKVARRELNASQTAVAEMQGKLAKLNESLRQTQSDVSSPEAAQSIANAISDVSSSQQTLTTVSSTLDSAASKIGPETIPTAPLGTCRLQVNAVTYIDGDCEIELSKGGSFRIWTVGRAGPSASVVRRGAYGIGSWQSGPGQPAVDLGTLRRKGACWFNETGQICAWK